MFVHTLGLPAHAAPSFLILSSLRAAAAARPHQRASRARPAAAARMRTSCNAFSSNTCFILFHFVASVSASSPHRFTRMASSARANATANARTHASVTPTHEPRLPPLQQCYQSPYHTFQLSIQAGSASSIAKHAPHAKRACTLSRRNLRSATALPIHAQVMQSAEYSGLTNYTCPTVWSLLT
jgi:hypothetical protein